MASFAFKIFSYERNIPLQLKCPEKFITEICQPANVNLSFMFVSNRYGPDGHTLGTPEFNPPKPVRLQWELNASCQSAIERSYQVVQGLCNDIDLRIFMHTAYGKGLMKECRVSPDAYIQMALQLAYFRVRFP